MGKGEIKKKRGFAAMSAEKRREIARLGGKAVKAENRSFSKDRKLAAEAGRVGGMNVPSIKRAFSVDRGLAQRAGARGASETGKNLSFRTPKNG